MRLRNIISIVLAMLGICTVCAQTPVKSDDTVYDIVDQINAGGIITIVQPGALDSRMRSDSKAKYADDENKEVGHYVNPNLRYTIQIFSDNKGASSKKAADYRKRTLEQKIPGMHAVVIYESPYWKVRVGSFKTEAEARVAERNIKSKFPSFSGDVSLIRYIAR